MILLDEWSDFRFIIWWEDKMDYRTSDEMTESNYELIKYWSNRIIAAYRNSYGDPGEREHLRFLVDLDEAEGRGESRRLDLRLFLPWGCEVGESLLLL